jgi:hypothetical protein
MDKKPLENGMHVSAENYIILQNYDFQFNCVCLWQISLETVLLIFFASACSMS